MLSFPNCKINIGLYITNKRTDGYHDLETVFYPIRSFHDALEVMPAKEESSLNITGLEIEGSNMNNLVWKAYDMMRKRFPAKVPKLDIYLRKALPMGAGLGGGSADGAFMLKLVNDFCKLELSNEYMEQMALELGSDCPFFIKNSPCFAMGRGERMYPIRLDLSAYSIQLICPENLSISTKEAFSIITPRSASYDLRQLTELPIERWKDNVKNDFEYPVFQQHPILSGIKKELYAQGAIYASMSGSGSTIYGIFPKGKRADISLNINYKEHYEE